MSNPQDAALSGVPLMQGVIGQDWYATHVAVRLKEFYFASSPWQRRLWNAGTVGGLYEVLEASRWRNQNVLREAALLNFCHEMQRAVGQDRGVASGRLRRSVADELKSGAHYDTRHWRTLEQLVPHVADGYLKRWAEAVTSASPPGPERVARAVASHLLDRGYSMAHLHAGMRRHIEARSSLQDVFEDAMALDCCERRLYDVLLPFEVMPKETTARQQPNWRTGPQVKTWLTERGGTRAGQAVPRYVGGFHYRLPALDSYAAAEQTAAIRDRLLARASYAAGYTHIKAFDAAWIHDPATADLSGVKLFGLDNPHRSVFVKSLVREKKIHDVGIEPTVLDDALELAAALNHSGSRGPAIASGWSALESLLCSPGDPEDAQQGRGVVVSLRAAALVACSWPRAELTALSYGQAGQTSSVNAVGVSGPRAQERADRIPAAEDFAQHLALADTNRARCRVMLDHYAQGGCLSVSTPEAAAAQERVLALLADPHPALTELRSHLESAFQRLYRMRNVVLHGGAASAAGLEVTLRTTAPLVGAALDRVAHAQLVDGVSPLSLAARAQARLDLLGEPGTPNVADLLE
ncbi:hypothetical protein LWF15_13870 [Kineosporia rhizophila]|uniref:hypothetical protein n=1 Tax=Kineosporia rhizophila TaxID=84633 RepID=UPI001E2F6836|nr:hypothetical protein [Kineosporia rhizophila]MCE0536595.1 hypothetical protein [Kineosporia rhizophila]